MKLTFRKHEVKHVAHLQALVAENPEAIEPGFRLLAHSLNLGRSTVDLAGLDARRTPVLIALGFVADDQMLFRMLEAYAWCLEYPESVRRLVPAEEGPAQWPPRVVFVGERVLESFQRKIGLLRFPAVDCFEFRCVEVNGATGFYLDAVDWAKGPSAVSQPAATRLLPHEAIAEHLEERLDERREDQWEGQGGAGEGAPAPAERERAADADEAAQIERATALGAKDRAVLDELELPPSRELAPTWRKFLERLTASFEGRSAQHLEDVPEAAGLPAAAPTSAPQPVPGAPAAPQLAPRDVVFQAEASASPVGEDPADKQRALLDGLTLPSEGELAPQWRKFLDRLSIDEGKIGAVKEYLYSEFPLCTVYDFHEFERSAQVFQLQDNHGEVSQLATITADFFRPWLEKKKLAQALRQAGQAGVLVTSAGLQIEKR
ncbi:MAG: hypothetical protein HYU25_10055 [Candidatus Rokubacteria bacterium]|nr:hypothetical protein [Candidatus Rokubacteria bacterium]